VWFGFKIYHLHITQISLRYSCLSQKNLLDNPEESKIGWFAYVPKNRVNSENWKLGCEHLNNLKIPPENTLDLPVN